MAKWLGEDVCELSTSFDELDDNLTSIDTVSEEVKLNVDVLAPVVENQILREGDGGLVVHHQCWWVSFHTGQLAQQPAQPHNWHATMAAATYSASHVDSATTFCFSDNHEIGADPRKTSTPKVLRRPSMSPAMSASLNTVSCSLLPPVFGKMIT